MTPEAERQTAQALAAARVKYVEETENAMLGQGYDMTVRASGAGKDTMHIGWALMSRPFVYKFVNESPLPQVRSMGFKRIIFVNTVTGQTWSFNVKLNRWGGD